MAKNKAKEKREALRLVLLGRTGVGKSATGNTILGREVFPSHLTPSPLTTECNKERAEVNGRNVCVVDTPDLFNTDYSDDVIMEEIPKYISMSAPGPHVFLVVIQLGRFTQQEQDTVKIINDIFGGESVKYTMVLFTYGEKLQGDSIEEFLSQNKKLAKFTSQCHGGYHVFNNRGPENKSQVTELLQKIDTMVEANGKGYFTTGMFQLTEVEIKEKLPIILKDIQENRKRGEEMLIERGKMFEKALKELRKRQEEGPIKTLFRTIASWKCAIGGSIGSLAGFCLEGLGCAIIGAVLGFYGGAVVGAGMSALWKCAILGCIGAVAGLRVGGLRCAIIGACVGLCGGAVLGAGMRATWKGAILGCVGGSGAGFCLGGLGCSIIGAVMGLFGGAGVGHWMGAKKKD